MSRGFKVSLVSTPEQLASVLNKYGRLNYLLESVEVYRNNKVLVLHHELREGFVKASGYKTWKRYYVRSFNKASHIEDWLNNEKRKTTLFKFVCLPHETWTIEFDYGAKT